MCGTQLLGEKTRHRRIPRDTPHRPDGFDRRPGSLRCPTRDPPCRFWQPRCVTETADQFRNGSRLAIRYNKRSAINDIGSLNRGGNRVGCVVHIGRINQGSARSDEPQLSLRSSLDDSFDELLVSGTPNQVGANRCYQHLVSAAVQHQLLSHCLATRVVAFCHRRISWQRGGANLRVPRVSDCRRRDVDKPLDTGLVDRLARRVGGDEPEAVAGDPTGDGAADLATNEVGRAFAALLRSAPLADLADGRSVAAWIESAFGGAP